MSGVRMWWVVLAVWMAAAGAAFGRQGPQERFLRVVDEGDGAVVGLELSVRELVPKGGRGPRIYLASAVHIADASFYRSMQAILDEKELVLYEQVQPPGGGHDDESLNDEQRRRRTERRLRLLGMLMEKERRGAGALPESIEALAAASDSKYAPVIRGASRDAWGREIAMLSLPEPAPGGWAFDLLSLGADGLPGGDGVAADIRLTDTPPPTTAEWRRMSGKPGIQKKLADALGLTFQLEAMDHDKPNWRNSDMSMDEVQERLERAGASGEALFRMLDGSGLMGALAGMLLEFVAGSPETRAMLKLMMVEVLSRADDFMPGAGAGAGMDKVMRVIVQERNGVVMRDLGRLVAREDAPATIGVMYGAGHMADLEGRIVAELGYEVGEVRWVRAIGMETATLPGGKKQAAQVREMVRQMIERQMKAGGR